MVSSCCAYSCTERQYKGTPVSFHRFPVNKEMSKRWIIATKREDFMPTSSTRLCSKHFKSTDYEANFGRVSLKKDVVPTIFDFPKHLQRKICSGKVLVRDKTKKDPQSSTSQKTQSEDFLGIANGQDIIKIEEQLLAKRFPHDLSARSLWISLLGLENTQVITKNTVLCSEHFEPGDVLLKINESKYIKSGALPKLSHPFFERSFRSKPYKTDNMEPHQLDYGSVEHGADPMLNEDEIKIEDDLEERVARKELIISNEEPTFFQKESNIPEEIFSISHEAQIQSKGPVFSQEEPNNFEETSKIFHGAQIQSSNPIRTFFNNIAQTVMSFPPSLAIRAKVEVLRVISDLELELLSRKNGQSGV